MSSTCEALAAGEIIQSQVEPVLNTDVAIYIYNRGKPIPPEILPLTKPFFTTKPCGNGLGFAIAKRIIEAHNGSLAITSSLGGTAVAVQLPTLPLAPEYS